MFWWKTSNLLSNHRRIFRSVILSGGLTGQVISFIMYYMALQLTAKKWNDSSFKEIRYFSVLLIFWHGIHRTNKIFQDDDLFKKEQNQYSIKAHCSSNDVSSSVASHERFLLALQHSGPSDLVGFRRKHIDFFAIDGIGWIKTLRQTLCGEPFCRTPPIKLQYRNEKW